MAKYKNGEVITGCVTGIEKYGIFVSVDERYSGLIHISEISSSFVKNIHDYAKIGEMINSKVLEEDEKSHKLKLSIKDMEYRIHKKRNTKIEETSTGFSTLKNMLDIWIEKKSNEIAKEKTKK